ncbi:MAG: glucose-6-phosphate 1-epimerase [Gammaproteobacteria bacterium]|jgi:glucose-6-phosphate 1-epimerase
MNTGQQMQSLFSRFGEIDGVVIELHKELLAININNSAAEATIFLQGAQLTQYQPRKGQPVIWLSPDCEYKTGLPLRGGIPVCWPWFGALDKNPESIQSQVKIDEDLAHGFVRQLEWVVDSIQVVNPAETELQMSLTLYPTEAWPFACKLILKFIIGAQLTLSLEVQNNDSKPFQFSSVLHSYFAIANIEKTVVNGLDGKSYIDCLKDWEAFTQSGEVVIDAEIDRIYETNQEDIRIVDSEGQRETTVACEGGANAVVWNPWVEKSKRLSQFNDLAYQQMLCVESANVGDDRIELAPGATHRIELTIKAEPLDN